MRKAFIILICIIPFACFAQNRDMDNWVDFGSSHRAKWLQIAPGKMGPNALPVPKMDYARVGDLSKLELGAHYHQMSGDTAINSHFSWFWNIAPGRAAVEIWGQPSETFRMSNDVRDDRQVYYDDEGWTTQVGDLYISTFVQILEDHRFLPDISINYTHKTTTGENFYARYTDAALDYYYFALGKSFMPKNFFFDEIRLAALAGFYVWQVNKVEMAQDEGPVVVAGLQLTKGTWDIYNEFGGYSGYGAYNALNRIYGDGVIQEHNDPLVYRARIQKTGLKFDFTAEFQTGFRDYHYQTFRLGLIYKFENPHF
jgi:hypothetical protein